MIGIILAAGKSKRMKSSLPKVLHNMLGMTMIEWVSMVLKKTGVKNIGVVVGVGKEKVKQVLGNKYFYVEQKEQKGTADAFWQTKNALKNLTGEILVCCGDTPLLTSKTLKNFLKFHQKNRAFCTVLSAKVPLARGYGRIIRNNYNEIIKIVEEKEATLSEKKILEINTGIYCFDSKEVFNFIKQIKPNNKQKEYYLTDLIKILNEKNKKVFAYCTDNYAEVLGINNRIEFSQSLKILQMRILNNLMLAGVTFTDPKTTYIDTSVQIEKDCIIYPGTILEGNTKIKSNCILGPYTKIKNCVIQENCEVQFSILQNSIIHSFTKIGPYAHLRQENIIGSKVKIGNFVELKKTKVKNNTNISHLTYLGDAQVGANTNIGAGTITCNYDGKTKHKTYIGNNVFVGSDSILVAPLKITKNSYIAAGSVITKNVPAYALGIARGKQVNIKSWVKRKKTK